jgi:hypothetical protein
MWQALVLVFMLCTFKMTAVSTAGHMSKERMEQHCHEAPFTSNFIFRTCGHPVNGLWNQWKRAKKAEKNSFDLDTHLGKFIGFISALKKEQHCMDVNTTSCLAKARA